MVPPDLSFSGTELDLPVPSRVTVPIDIVVRIATWKPEALVDPSYASAERVLRESLTRSVEVCSPWNLRIWVLVRGEGWLLLPPRAARSSLIRWSSLISVAVEADRAPHLRLDATVALAELAGRGLVGAGSARALRKATSSLRPRGLRAADLLRRSLSRAALAVRASRLTEEEQAILFTLSRDPDPRAREIVAQSRCDLPANARLRPLLRRR